MDNTAAFEKEVEAWTPGRAILSTREDRFDVNHGLSYAPVKYERADIVRPTQERPDDDWLKNAFAAFVRDEFGTAVAITEPEPIEVDPARVDLTALGLRLRDQFEQRLIYEGALEQVLAGVPGMDPVPRVHAMLCNDAFGQGVNKQNTPLATFQDLMANMKVGCRIMLLGLPYRDQNPLRVNNAPSDATLAEAQFLVRLHCTALAIYQALPTGADVVVISDGSLYAPILGVADEEAQRYLTRVRRLRDQLNMRGTVAIIDLKHLISLYDAGSGAFDACCTDLAARLLAWRRDANAPADFIARFDALAQGMRWNLNSRTAGGDVAKWIADGTASGALPKPEQVDEVAARYAAVNLALRWHNVVASMLPTAIRGTMHPKPGQVALPKLGSCFPWNGVAVLENDHRGDAQVEIHSLAEARRRGLKLRARQDDNGAIVYYERQR